MQLSTLQLVTRTFYDVQDVRKKAGSRVYSMKRELVMPLLSEEDGLDRKTVETKYELCKPTLPEDKVIEVDLVEKNVFQRAYDYEKGLMKDISDDIVLRPLYSEWIKYVYNIDCILTAAMMSEIMDIGRFQTISKLWQYAGFGVMNIAKTNGMTKLWFPTQEDAINYVEHATGLEEQTALKWKKTYDKESKTSEYLSRCCWGIKYEYKTVASRRMLGLPYHCNPNLKVTGWKIAQQFQMSSPDKSKYRKYYDEVKGYYTKHHSAEKSKGHINNMSLRKTTKLFFSHVWIQWRKLEGLPITKPYCIEQLGHRDYIEPYYDAETT